MSFLTNQISTKPTHHKKTPFFYLVSLLHNHHVDQSRLGGRDATAHTLSLARCNALLATMKLKGLAALTQQQTNTLASQHTLHKETTKHVNNQTKSHSQNHILFLPNHSLFQKSQFSFFYAKQISFSFLNHILSSNAKKQIFVPEPSQNPACPSLQ
jgi:hypothetical protein